MSFALSVIAKTTILLACASLITLGLRRHSASARHAVWAIALLSALILPVASAYLPEVALPILPEETFDATPLFSSGNPPPAPSRTAGAPEPSPVTRPSPAAVTLAPTVQSSSHPGAAGDDEWTLL